MRVNADSANNHTLFIITCSVMMRRSTILRSSEAVEGLGSASEEGQSTTHLCVCSALLMEGLQRETADSG